MVNSRPIGSGLLRESDIDSRVLSPNAANKSFAPAIDNSPKIGLDFGFSLGYPEATAQQNTISDIHAKAKYLGGKRIRIIISPYDVGSGPSYNWTRVDQQFLAAKSAGLTPHVLFDNPRNTNGTGFVTPTTSVITPLVTAAVARYKDRCSTWEILNEINHIGFWGGTVPSASGYKNILQEAYTAIHAAQPQAIVVSAGLMQVNTQNNTGQFANLPNGQITVSPTDYLTALYDAGAGPYFDAVGNHPYTLETGIEPTAPVPSESSVAFTRDAMLYNIMVAHGDAGKMIWWSEVGFPTVTTTAALGYTINESQQLTYLTNVLQLASKRPWVGPVMIYSVRDLGNDTTHSEEVYGQYKNNGDSKACVAWWKTVTKPIGLGLVPVSSGGGATLPSTSSLLKGDGNGGAAAAAAGTDYVAPSDSRLSDQRTPSDNSVTTSKVSDRQITDAKLLPSRVGGFESTGVRRARTQLSAAATGGFGFANNNWVFRLPFIATVDVSAFSITFANRWTGDPFNAAGSGTGVVTVNSVWIGQAALDANGQPNGQFVPGTSKQVSNSLTVPTNGGDISTAWVSNYPLVAGKLYLISYGLTQDGANYAEGSNICWFAGTAANAGQNAPSGIAPYMASTLDVRMDYRHGVEPSGLWIGPSIMQGLSNGLLNGSLVGGAWGWLNYPNRFSQPRKHAAQVMAVKSSQYGDFTSGTGWRWVRAAIANQNIDYVVIGELGTNNSIAGTSLATSIADLRSLLSYIRTNLPGRPIYLCTNTPSSTLPSGKLTTAIAANGTSVVSDTDLGASGVQIRVGIGLQAEVRTTSAKSGAGPYTYTVPAMTYAHPVGERVQGPQDLIRQTINDMMIAGQFDCDGIIDLSSAVADPAKPQQQSLDYVDKDWIHTTPVGQTKLRDAALNVIPS